MLLKNLQKTSTYLWALFSMLGLIILFSACAQAPVTGSPGASPGSPASGSPLPSPSLTNTSPNATESCCQSPSPISLVVLLSGAEEVPPISTQASGLLLMYLNSAGTEFSFKLTAAGIENITMAHIHAGAKGQNGAPVVWLYPQTGTPLKIAGVFDGVLSEGTFDSSNLIGTLQGQPLSALIDKIKAGEAYVNIHTEQFPSGLVRGQIQFPKAKTEATPSSVSLEFDAVVQKIEGNSLTIQKDDSSVLTLSLDSNTWVQLVNGQKGTLADVRPETKVEIYLGSDRQTVYKIELRDSSNSAAGKVEGTLAGLGAPYLTLKTESGESVVIELTGYTRIERFDGSLGNRLDLKPGTKVEAYFNPASRWAFRIEIKP